MEQNNLDLFKIFIIIIIIIIIKLEIYFEYYLAKDALDAPWCTECDPH